jgi:hypothetical protein
MASPDSTAVAVPAEPPLGYDVTLVSQTSVDRMWMISHMARRWGGPISIAIFVTDEALLLKERSWLDRIANQPGAYITEVPSGNSTEYPINFLRNIAIKRVNTSHFFLADIDLWPSASSYKEVLTQDPALLGNTYAALVVPAFEFLVSKRSQDKPDPEVLPDTFEGLRDCASRTNRTCRCAHTPLAQEILAPALGPRKLESASILSRKQVDECGGQEFWKKTIRRQAPGGDTHARTHARTTHAHTRAHTHARTTRTHARHTRTRAHTRTHARRTHARMHDTRAHARTHARMHDTRAHTRMHARHTRTRTHARTTHAHTHARIRTPTHTHARTTHARTRARTHTRAHARTHARTTHTRARTHARHTRTRTHARTHAHDTRAHARTHARTHLTPFPSRQASTSPSHTLPHLSQGILVVIQVSDRRPPDH